MNPAALARNLDGHRQGNNWRCDCPLGCGYKLSLANGDDGKLLAYCHGGHGYEAILTALVQFGLLDDGECFDAPLPSSKPKADPAQNIETARSIYAPLAPAAGTPAECYLRSRAIGLPVPSTLRFGACPHRLGGAFPAMAAPVVGVDGKLTGIHMTYLHPDGTGKADFADPDFQRETRGVIRGGSIRLAPHIPERELIIAEGIETTLSAMEIFGLPGWSSVSAAGLKTVELPPTVRCVVIAEDNDLTGAGQRNALAARQRWTGEGRAVRVVIPPEAGTDFNTILGRGKI